MKKVLDTLFPKERANRLVAAAAVVEIDAGAEGEEYNRRGLLKKMRLFTDALGLDNNCWEAYLGRAKVLIALGRRAAGVKDLRKAHELHPDEAEVTTLLLVHAEATVEAPEKEGEGEDDWW